MIRQQTLSKVTFQMGEELKENSYPYTLLKN